jgi:hypothetical protein
VTRPQGNNRQQPQSIRQWEEKHQPDENILAPWI